MFTVQLFSFNKKENSTARPSSSSATSFNCKLLKPSGILNPAIELDIGLSNSPASYNYAYIPEFNRYYWIEEWTNNHPLWIARLSVDVLATYKTVIGNTDMYVLRASNSYDGSIIDNLYPTKTTSTLKLTPFDMFSTTIANGVFVLGVASQYGSFGSINYVALKPSSMDALTYYLIENAITTNHGFSIDDAQLALQKSLIDPLSYIKSCVYIPVPYTSFWGRETNVDIMGWDTGVTGKSVIPEHDIETITHDFTVQKHPQATTRGDFCNVAPYSESILICQPFGEVLLDSLLLSKYNSITVDIDIELHSGASVMTIRNGSVIFNRLAGMVGVPVTLSQVTRDYLGATQGAVSAIGNMANAITNPAKAIEGTVGAINGIISSVQAIQPRQYSIGNNGSFINYSYDVLLQQRFFELVDDDIDHNGRPLCKIVKPNTLGGYMLIQDADISINGTSNELSKIRGYLEGGFYYE